MEKKLPIYDVVISDDEMQGVSFISLVDEPAIQVDWIKLAKEEQMAFKAEADKQILYGPFLIPNKLIYRYSQQLGEYYVRFSKEQIEKIARKFNEDLNNKNLNFQHTEEKVDAVVVENWLVDAEFDKSKKFGFNLEEGTWFGGVFVKDQEFWNEKIKTEEVKGFSVEVLAELELALQKINQKNMQKENIKLANVMKTDGTPVYYEGTEFVVGTPVFLDEAMTEPAPDGEHMLEGGMKIIVTNGLVSEIMEIEESVDTEVDAAVEAISMEQVQEMINTRFAELNDEVTALKKELEMLKGKEKGYEEKMSSIEEKLANTPAAVSITSKEQPKAKLLNEFELALSRVQSFAKK